MSLVHVLRNALRPGFLPVMADKLVVRVRDRRYARNVRAARERYAAMARSPAAYAEAVDAALWSEARAAAAAIRAEGRARLERLGLPMGGPADTALLYFLVRKRRPKVVVETGVAAGFSSHAILAALEKNGEGELWSSDFPYVRLPNPARAVGCAVPEALRGRWHLLLRGDVRNLRRIVASTGPIDLFHYDSDKSYVGRRRALSIVAPHLRTGAAVIFDDLQDNAFFLDLLDRRGGPGLVFSTDDKYVGMIPAW